MKKSRKHPKPVGRAHARGASLPLRVGERAVDKWAAAYGLGAQTLLFRLSGVSLPTIRQVMHGGACRADVALKLQAVVGGTLDELTTEPRPRKVQRHAS